MKLVEIKEYNNILVKKYTGKRRKGKQWVTVKSVAAESKLLMDKVEFELINDFGHYMAASYFKDNWSPERLADEGICSEEEFNQIVNDAELALMNYKGIVIE